MQGMAAGCVLLWTLVVCKILGEGTIDKRNVWVWETQIFLSFLVFLWGGVFFSFFFPQTWLAAKNWNKNEERGLFIWAFILDIICQCADDDIAQKRHLKYAEVLLRPVVALHMLNVKHLFKCFLQSGPDSYCQSWTALSSLLHDFCSGKLENLALSM